MKMILTVGGLEVEEFVDADGNPVDVFAREGDELVEIETPFELPEENNPIVPELKEVIWGGIAFFLLFAVLARFAYPALRQTMADRSTRIRNDLEAAERAKDDAARLQREYEASLSNARAEANRIVEDAREQAEVVRAERIAAIDTEIAERRAAAMADIDAAKAQATSDLTGQIATLAIGAAEKVVGHSLDRSSNERIVEDYIQQVGAQAGTR